MSTSRAQGVHAACKEGRNKEEGWLAGVAYFRRRDATASAAAAAASNETAEAAGPAPLWRLGDADGVTGGVPETDGVRVLVGVRVPEAVMEPEAVLVVEGEAPVDRVAVGEGVGVPEDEVEAVTDGEAVGVVAPAGKGHGAVVVAAVAAGPSYLRAAPHRAATLGQVSDPENPATVRIVPASAVAQVSTVGVDWP